MFDDGDITVDDFLMAEAFVGNQHDDDFVSGNLGDDDLLKADR